ncbi:MAG: cold-shock protein [Planctomycetota bacterium]
MDGNEREFPEVVTRRDNLVGRVKWFDPQKGYGFIVGPEGQDVFVHYSQIVADGFKVLREGITVKYKAVHSDKGWAAQQVVRVDQQQRSSGEDHQPEP